MENLARQYEHMMSKIILVDDLSKGIESVNECIPGFLAHETPESTKEISVLMLGFGEDEASHIKTGDMKVRRISKDDAPLNRPPQPRTEQLNFQLLWGLRYIDPDLIIARCRDSLSEKLINLAVPSGHVVYLICDDGETVDELIMEAAKNSVPSEMERLMEFIDVIDLRKEAA